MDKEKQKLYWLLYSTISAIEEPFLEDEAIKYELEAVKSKLEKFLITKEFWEDKEWQKADLLTIATFMFYIK